MGEPAGLGLAAADRPGIDAPLVIPFSVPGGTNRRQPKKAAARNDVAAGRRIQT